MHFAGSPGSRLDSIDARSVDFSHRYPLPGAIFGRMMPLKDLRLRLYKSLEIWLFVGRIRLSSSSCLNIADLANVA